ncbi:hypothetical protein [Dechloromonas sp. CZR5]|uniref:hypothetical protein n=1 Tax=Dechloromonas sp. CZR5 TaxID=2608630 RepID=UPI00123E0273|nr:hypothetical protein [Dechloromonas sp. CZR5]
MADEADFDKIVKLIEERKKSDTDLSDSEVKKRSALALEHYKTFSDGSESSLHPGMLVKWKQGLKNRKRPRPNEPAVVIEILDKPFYDEENGSGTPYFREPMNLVLGMVDDDGEFIIYHYDKRRFRPFSDN